MVSVPAEPAPSFDRAAVQRASAEVEALVVGVVGEFEESLWLGLASNGLYPERLGDGTSPAAISCDVVLAIVDDLEHLTALVATGVPVVAVPPGSRVEILAELLRRGVSDVLSPPIKVDELARKLRRAVGRIRRQRRRTP